MKHNNVREKGAAVMKTFGAIVLGLALWLSPTSAQAISLDFVPSVQNVLLGNPVSVALRISGLGSFAAPSLGAFDLDVSFNSSLLAFNSVTYGDPSLGDQLDLFGLGSLTSTTLGAGSVNLFQLSFDFASDLDTLQAGAFTLATLTFDTLALGTSSLNFANVVLGDSLGNPLTASLGTASITVNQAVAAVPEPSTLVLLGSGLVLLAGVAWRRPR